MWHASGSRPRAGCRRATHHRLPVRWHTHSRDVSAERRFAGGTRTADDSTSRSTPTGVIPDDRPPPKRQRIEPPVSGRRPAHRPAISLGPTRFRRTIHISMHRRGAGRVLDFSMHSLVSPAATSPGVVHDVSPLPDAGRSFLIPDSFHGQDSAAETPAADEWREAGRRAVGFRGPKRYSRGSCAGPPAA